MRRKTMTGEKSIQPPKFEHDCEKCYFMGHWRASPEGVIYDAYVCSSTHWDSVILRFGSEGGEYLSAPAYVIKNMDNSVPENKIFKNIYNEWVLECAKATTLAGKFLTHD
jgi:hypothetical protein